MAVVTNNVPPLTPQIASKKEVAASPKAEDVIELSSSDDSMYILLRSDERRAGGGAARTSTRPAAEQNSSKGKRPSRSTKRERSKCGASARKSQKFTGEAEEASTDYESEFESCAESELNAQDMYHEAIMGVRRANNARSQLRSATINCPVCAKFAAFLQHFTA